MFSSKVLITAFAALLFSASVAYGWSFNGHYTICKIAEARLTKEAKGNVSKLLQNKDLASLCKWADKVSNIYPWSRPLHYVDTPDVCNYDYNRDCKDEEGVTGRCVAGAINNYTDQLFTYRNSASPKYNLTEALLFLANFMGDIHQPLKVGFASDKGGNLIKVQLYNKHINLHRVWSDEILKIALRRLYGSNVNELVNGLENSITIDFVEESKMWKGCPYSQLACPDVYATEGIQASCNWAYKGVSNGSILGDGYFFFALPVVYHRLAQAGVRLADTLNRIYGGPYQMPISSII